MNTTPVPPVPSREAVDLIKRARKAEQRIGNQVWRGDGDSHIFVSLLIGELRAEVERLTERNEILDIQLTAAVQEYQKARATVTEQGAALKLVRGALAREPSFHSLVDKIDAALASAQSREQEKTT